VAKSCEAMMCFKLPTDAILQSRIIQSKKKNLFKVLSLGALHTGSKTCTVGKTKHYIGCRRFFSALVGVSGASTSSFG